MCFSLVKDQMLEYGLLLCGIPSLELCLSILASSLKTGEGGGTEKVDFFFFFFVAFSVI